MRAKGIAGLAVLAAVGSQPATADTSPMLQALRDQNWPVAQSLAAQNPDKLAATIVEFIRLLAPGQGAASEIGIFAAAHSTWPDQPILRKRLGEAVARETDQAQILADCRAYKPSLDTALLKCAAAEKDAKQPAKAAELARQAWLTGVTGEPEEAAFLADWHSDISATDQWRRFDALDWAGSPAADRQAGRVESYRRPLAAARLAFRHNDPRALDFLPAVPQALRSDPALILEQSRYLRGQNAAPAALALWRAAGVTAEATAPAEHRAAFWTERDRLARALLETGDNDGAYFLADDAAAGTDQAPDALFLSGWIALRRRHDSARATAKFQALAAQSPAVITQARAYYWLARTTNDGTAAKQDFTRAAAYPTTYYGQLAIAALDGPQAVPARITAYQEPVFPHANPQAFAQTEPVHAATILVGWGDNERARQFLSRQALDNAANPAQLALASHQATELGLPEIAVQATRYAGRDGVILRQYGWPRPYAPPAGVDPALALGIMRQESSFDPAIVSPAGAIGLMQMMPGTAREEGGSADELTDPDVNMRLGTAYLQKLLGQFSNVTPYAVAAYNAGPHRVRAWLTANGDAAGKPDDMIDWIEQIPFAETRNYVQRVLENRTIYAAPAAEPPP